MTEPRDWCHCRECRPVVLARYHGGPCAICGHRVRKGDLITIVDGETWLHEDCADVEQPAVVAAIEAAFRDRA